VIDDDHAQIAELLQRFLKERSGRTGPATTGRTVGQLLRAVEAATEPTAELGLEGEMKQAALCSALLHDVGRFPQIAKYSTLRDALSENHALLSIKVIGEEKVLEALETNRREMIIAAIANHNRFTLDGVAGEEQLLLCKMLRDADKLDIWRVLIEADESEDEQEKEAVFLGLPELETFNSKVVAEIMAGRLVNHADVHSRHDFRLLAASWVYDLNFAHSLLEVKKRCYLEALAERLPAHEHVKRAFERMAAVAEK
jgi:hypothetical protein